MSDNKIKKVYKVESMENFIFENISKEFPKEFISVYNKSIDTYFKTTEKKSSAQPVAITLYLNLDENRVQAKSVPEEVLKEIINSEDQELIFDIMDYQNKTTDNCIGSISFIPATSLIVNSEDKEIFQKLAEENDNNIQMGKSKNELEEISKRVNRELKECIEIRLYISNIQIIMIHTINQIDGKFIVSKQYDDCFAVYTYDNQEDLDNAVNPHEELERILEIDKEDENPDKTDFYIDLNNLTPND